MPIVTSKTVAVITGASSGIGRATARAFARRGARVVLAARRAEALEEVAEECRARGGKALVVPTDVSDEAAVDHLAGRTLEEFGHFDVWINNAGLAMYARFEDAPSDAVRRLVDTNLMGTIYGSRAAMRHFKERGRGTLIQVSSVLGVFTAPYMSYYAATKFGIVGLSSVLRQEALAQPGIHVATVLPGAIDTPIYEQSANYTGVAVKPIPPVVSVERVARAILSAADLPRPYVVVGYTALLGTIIARMSPLLVELVNGIAGQFLHFQARRQQRTAGNVFEPRPEFASKRGGWSRLSAPVAPPATRADGAE